MRSVSRRLIYLRYRSSLLRCLYSSGGGVYVNTSFWDIIVLHWQSHAHRCCAVGNRSRPVALSGCPTRSCEARRMASVQRDRGAQARGSLVQQRESRPANAVTAPTGVSSASERAWSYAGPSRVTVARATFAKLCEAPALSHQLDAVPHDVLRKPHDNPAMHPEGASVSSQARDLANQEQELIAEVSPARLIATSSTRCPRS